MMRGWSARAVSVLLDAVIPTAIAAERNQATVTFYQVRNITAAHAEATRPSASYRRPVPSADGCSTRSHGAPLTLLPRKEEGDRPSLDTFARGLAKQHCSERIRNTAAHARGVSVTAVYSRGGEVCDGAFAMSIKADCRVPHPQRLQALIRNSPFFLAQVS